MNGRSVVSAMIVVACTLVDPGLAAGQLGEVAYQGELKERGSRFNGTAQMKFAIVSGCSTLCESRWSNDGTSVNGAEPLASVDIAVNNGLFSVHLGAAPMTPLTPGSLGGVSGAALRVWVKTGASFEQLSDQRLASVPFALRSEDGGRGDNAWLVSGANVYRPAGRVGIGTAEPATALHVVLPHSMIELNSTGSPDGPAGITLRHLASSVGGAGWSIVTGVVREDIGASDNLAFRSAVGGQTKMVLTSDGRLGLGTTQPTTKLQVEGTTTTSVLEITGGSDLAEPFVVASDEASMIVPGSLVVIDPDHPTRLRLSSVPYDVRVVGVISGANGLSPGVMMRAEGTSIAEGTHPVALSGRVWCLADASYGSIRPGDLLTSSATRGMAMIAQNPKRRGGAIVGKALTSLERGRGLVLLLVSLQ